MSDDQDMKEQLADGPGKGRGGGKKKPRRRKKAERREKGDDATAAVAKIHDAPCDLCYELAEPHSLSCQHSFCEACVRACISSCSSSARKNFNGLFCPFKCGTAFNSCRSLPEDLRGLIQHDLQQMELSRGLMVNKAEEDGVVTAEVRERLSVPEKLYAFVSEKYGAYNCSKCKCLFVMRNLCGVAGEEEERNGGGEAAAEGRAQAAVTYLCDKCTIKGGARMQIRLWRPSKESSDDSFHSLISSEGQRTFDEMCTSIENADDQQSELDVISAVYPELIEVVNSPPSKIGDPCTLVIIRAPKVVGTVEFRKSNLPRVQAQMQFKIWLPSTYPSSASPFMKLVIGDLSALEFDSYMRRSVTARMVQVLTSHRGEQCIFNCIQALQDWLADIDTMQSERAAQTHRLHISENILTLRCPRYACRRAIVDFDGCFALYCEGCKCGFCAWCLLDCGTDAHTHVLECSKSLAPGDHFAPFSLFNHVHNERRKKEIQDYIRTSVDPPDRPIVIRCIQSDLKDLGIELGNNFW